MLCNQMRKVRTKSVLHLDLKGWSENGIEYFDMEVIIHDGTLTSYYRQHKYCKNASFFFDCMGTNTCNGPYNLFHHVPCVFHKWVVR